ncbi:MAG: signal peptidase I [Microthrixaceae bacterium]
MAGPLITTLDPPTGTTMTVFQRASVGRFCAVAAGLATIGAIALTVLLAVPQRWPMAVALVGALLWGLGGPFAVALIPTGITGGDHPAGRHPSSKHGPAEAQRIGTLMNLGRVPDQVARMTSAIAVSSGPVVLVVPPDRSVPMGLDPAVLVVGSDRPDSPDTMAAFYDQCDAVLVVSARAFPATGCHVAARLLAQGASWVQGTSVPLNRDRFGPVRREALDSRLRKRASHAGLWCWEPDATLVSTALLRAHPLAAGRPMGAWLRDRSAEGAFGVTVDTVLTHRAAPVAADGYWPDTTARQCAWAADLSDAARTDVGSGRARSVAAGLLVRALSGWSLLLWLAVLVLLPDGSPVRHSEGLLGALVLLSIVLRWWASRLATGVRPSPVADIVAGLYGLPGSLAATVSAVTCRVRPPRRAVSTRPLVWLALGATAAAANVVLTAEPGVGAARLAAGVAVGLLVLTWVFTVRSLIERSWRRVGFRIPLDLPAVVVASKVASEVVPGPDHTLWRLIDGGPGGFALVGPSTGHVQGDEVTVRVPRTGGATIILHGTVAATRRHVHEDELIGVEIRRVEPGSAAWARTLTDAASNAPATGSVMAKTAPVGEQIDPNRWGHRLDRLAIGLVIAMSLAVVLSLGLVLMGLRPLVIRSGSMEPTYGVGDVVLVATEPASEISQGQVVTRFDAPETADSLTHRVRQISRAGDNVEVETRGDANDKSEYWSVTSEERVGVVVASVPAIGLLSTSVRSSVSWAVIVGALVLGVIGMLFRPRRRSTQQRLLWDGSLKPTASVPTNSSMTSFGERK